jgi:DNA polymerase-3 subunit alpha
MADGATVFTAGMIVSHKPFVTRKGQSMAFLEIEDRIMGTELVAFPTVWAKAASFVKKGSLVFVRAKVQLGDEDYKLLADDILPLESADLKQQVERLRRISQTARSSGGYTGRSGASSATTAPMARTPMASGTKAPAAPSLANAPASSGKVERVYIRIDEPHQQPATLIRLKLLLKAHPGELATVLRYEREKRNVALSDEYKVHPAPELVSEMEKLLGEGSIKVK